MGLELNKQYLPYWQIPYGVRIDALHLKALIEGYHVPQGAEIIIKKIYNIIFDISANSFENATLIT